MCQRKKTASFSTVRLIASGSTAEEIYSKAKAEGVKIPFVELVTDGKQVPFTGGWLS